MLERDGADIDANALSQVVVNIIAVAQPAIEAQRAFVQNILLGINTTTMTKQHAHSLIVEYKAKSERAATAHTRHDRHSQQLVDYAIALT